MVSELENGPGKRPCQGCKCSAPSLVLDLTFLVMSTITEAIREYVRRKRIRPQVLKHLDDSIDENKELGKLLAG